MGKVSVLEVVLSNGTGVYIAGQLLQGHVNLELNNNLKLRDIKIKVRGKAFVHWTEQLMRGPGESRFREIRHHSSTEEYIDWSQSLLGRTSDSAPKRELPAGEYTYPFQFQLPSNVPTSFEGQYGHLRYWVKVTIERPWNNDQSAKKIFTLICPMDLNREPSAANSAQCQKQKRLCCLCCRSGPISARLALGQRGFVSGETIHVNAEVTNMSRRKMAGSSVELLMTVIYHTPTKSRAMTRQVIKVKHGPIPAGDSDLWEEEKLVIPPLPPSYLNGCSIIDIKYTLEFRVDPVGPAFELHVPMEILIGTVPLHAVVQRYLATHHIAPPSPQRPAHSSQAGYPIHPAHPAHPAHGSQAGYPAHPAHGSQAGYPAHQAHGSQAGYPAHPAHGSQAGYPVYPAHGSQAGYPAHPSAVLEAQSRQPQYFVPPKFAHYVFGHSRTQDEEDDENTRGDSHFTPIYIYYTWQPEDLQLRRQQGLRFTA